MRAALLSAFGGPEALELRTVADPEPRPGWAAVRLRAAAVNWHDVLVRQGVYPVALPLVIGADGAGVREDTGAPVIVYPGLWWGAQERAPSAAFEILGDHRNGTYAELVAVPEENVFPCPEGWDWSAAASLGVAGATAYRALFTRAGLVDGETVLVLGAGGGVSTFAVSLAVMAGARVLVTSSSPEKIARAQELGALDGVLYTEEGWEARVGELAGEAGVDVVIDSIGSTWPAALSVLNPGGRLVSFGATAGDRATVDVRPFYFGQYSILGTTMASAHDFEALLRFVAGHPRWRPVIDAALPLEAAAEAHARMERREHFGKLVLTMG